MGEDAETHSQTLGGEKAQIGEELREPHRNQGGKTVGTRGIKYIRRIRLTESTKQGSHRDCIRKHRLHGSVLGPLYAL